MSQVLDYKQKLLEELDQLTPEELQRIYKLIVLIKDEFLDLSGEERYYTPSWQEAEREATEEYRKGNLKRFESVQEMADYIEAEAAD